MGNSSLYEKEGLYSVVLNTALFIVKYVVGTFTGSVAIIADGWHSMSDSLSSVVVFIGSKISGAPPDKKHPYGHGRVEAIASVIVSMILFTVAYEFIRKAIERLLAYERADFGTAAYIITIISIIMKELLTLYARRIYKKTGSQMMKAEAMHHRSDSLSSVVVLAGILSSRIFWWIDGVLCILISIMIAYSAFVIIRDTVSSLIGEAPEDNEIDNIKMLIRNAAGQDLSSHHFHVHDYGDHKELTFHIKLNGNTTLNQTHCITEKIEKEIRDETGYDVTIHPENE